MNSLMESWPRKHRITVDEYYRMAEVGLLAPDARVELIEGEIIDMAPIGSDHSSVVNELARLFILSLGDKAIVHIQGAVRLSSDSEPQPDLALLAPRADRYRHSQPSAADILLIIEVSDSTLHHDRNVKAPLYAHHGVPEVWIVDLQNSELHIYRSLRSGKYQDQLTEKNLGITGISTIPGAEVDLSRLLTD